MKDFLRQNEQIVMSTPGAIDIGTLDSLWRPGNLHLTNQRVFFERQGRMQLAPFLEDIVDVRLEMRKWILQHTRQLCLSYRASPGSSVRVAYIAVASPVGWQKAIKDRITLALLKG